MAKPSAAQFSPPELPKVQKWYKLADGKQEIQNIGARDVKVFIANFLLQVREFLFLICV